MIDVNKLKFDERGLIPAVVQDFYTKKVLTVAYMNKESLDITAKTGRACFYSRSRNCLWLKGETSGNYQNVVSIVADCDWDALTVVVKKIGPAYHTGSDSCFFNPVWEKEQNFSVEALYQLIKGRKTDKKEGSYTSYLFDKGIDKILKKVGEECTEVVIAGKSGDKAETIFEISDLLYHVLVLMVEAGISIADIIEELSKRHIIDRKVKQEKTQ